MRVRPGWLRRADSALQRRAARPLDGHDHWRVSFSPVPGLWTPSLPRWGRYLRMVPLILNVCGEDFAENFLCHGTR
ncbi:hypothetical protein NDU88_005122 [Pleurodeles waltl]|uniref:Uncharacterized protein n=1 Tax=Pleurodeles waltl TaxID=8319 RepID=A0AAV7TUL4_PLEWA|nr:hypothetical protein NDU88_005122 [Pleurodeles waltl]